MILTPKAHTMALPWRGIRLGLLSSSAWLARRISEGSLASKWARCSSCLLGADAFVTSLNVMPVLATFGVITYADNLDNNPLNWEAQILCAIENVDRIRADAAASH